jgi:hypothetical protein
MKFQQVQHSKECKFYPVECKACGDCFERRLHHDCVRFKLNNSDNKNINIANISWFLWANVFDNFPKQDIFVFSTLNKKMRDCVNNSSSFIQDLERKKKQELAQIKRERKLRIHELTEEGLFCFAFLFIFIFLLVFRFRLFLM